MVKEFDLLKIYMDIYIDLLPYYTSRDGMKVNKHQLPTFEYFKKTLQDPRYSLIIPHYKESKNIKGTTITKAATAGIGTKAMMCRYYNYWMGNKFYLSEWTLDKEAIKASL